MALAHLAPGPAHLDPLVPPEQEVIQGTMPRKKRKDQRIPYKRSDSARHPLDLLPGEVADDVRVANLPMLRVLLVGGDPHQRNALALFISRALEPLVDRKACTSAFVDEPNGRDAVEALEGYRVTIRDGGS